MPTQITDADVTEFMSEFARYLVAAGVSSSRFIRIARLAFFRAASQNAKFTNSRINRSAVAAMTGLTRAQVRELAHLGQSAPKGRSDQIEKVVRGWNTDPAFTTNLRHAPRPLDTTEENRDFRLLVRKYGGDVSARSILREMVRNNLVTVKGNLVHLNRIDKKSRNQTQLQHLSQTLAQLLRNSKEDSRGAISLRSIVREVSYPSSSRKGRALMQRKSEKGLQDFLSGLQAAGAAASVETPPTKKQTHLTTRTRIMVLTEELDSKSLASNRRIKEFLL